MAVVLTYAAKRPRGQDRPDGRAVRQAALASRRRSATASSCPPTAATWSTASTSPPASRVPDPRRLLRGLPLLRGDAEPRPRLHQGRLRRPAPGARLEPGLRARSRPAGKRYEQLAGEIDRALALHARLRRASPRSSTRVEFYSSARGADPRLRAGAHPDRLAHRPARTTCRRTSSGSASAPASSTARTSSSCASIRNPIGVKLGPTTTAEDALALIEKLNPDTRAGPPDLHHPDGRVEVREHAPAAGGEGDRERRPGGVDLRPHARQHLRGAERPQDPPLRRRPRRGARASSRCTARSAPIPGGVHIEFTGDDVTECVGGGHEIVEDDLPSATRRPATRASTEVSRSTWPSWWPSCTARRSRSHRRERLRGVRASGGRLLFSPDVPVNAVVRR